MATPSSPTARQLALTTLLQVLAGAYADVALHRVLAKAKPSPQEAALATELVYGTVRRQRTLDGLISQLGTRPADKQPRCCGRFCSWGCINCATSAPFQPRRR